MSKKLAIRAKNKNTGNIRIDGYTISFDRSVEFKIDKEDVYDFSSFNTMLQESGKQLAYEIDKYRLWDIDIRNRYPNEYRIMKTNKKSRIRKKYYNMIDKKYPLKSFVPDFEKFVSAS